MGVIVTYTAWVATADSANSDPNQTKFEFERCTAISNQDMKDIKMDELAKLSHLNAVIQEALRLVYPAVPSSSIQQKVTSIEGIKYRTPSSLS